MPSTGARGILFRFKTFAQFLAEVGRKVAGTRLDRIDSGNVKWSTPLESNHNKRQRQSKKGKANTEKSEPLTREQPTQSRNLPCTGID